MAWAGAATARLPVPAPRAAAAHHRRSWQRSVCAAADANSSGSATSRSSSARSALECSLRLASMRAAEQREEFPLFADPYSEAALQAVQQAGLLAGEQGAAAQPGAAGGVRAEAAAGLPAAAAVLGAGTSAWSGADAEREALATRFLDEQLLKAVTIVNLERDLTQEYNQVVLLGDAFDTRPFRLPWPEGTVLFSLAPAQAHAAADAAFKALGARVPRGCLLRRVPADLEGGGAVAGAASAAGAASGSGSGSAGGSGGFAAALERAGFRSDRLSVWVLQGLACQGDTQADLAALFTDLCNMAAFDSLVAGLLPPLERRQLDNVLASFGLLGAGVDFGPQTDWSRWDDRLALDPSGPRPWLFVAQQKRLSLGEMDLYESHVAAAGEVDEDFEGHFS